MTHSSVGSVGSVTSSIVSSAGVPQPQTGVANTPSLSPSFRQVGVGISKEFRISAAHHLPLHKGKCKNPHGHNYRIRVTLVGEVDPLLGMVKDFYDVEGDFDLAVGVYDHKDLNDFYETPTAENLAFDWLIKLMAIDSRYQSVVVWETDDCFAVASAIT